MVFLLYVVDARCAWSFPVTTTPLKISPVAAGSIQEFHVVVKFLQWNFRYRSDPSIIVGILFVSQHNLRCIAIRVEFFTCPYGSLQSILAFARWSVMSFPASPLIFYPCVYKGDYVFLILILGIVPYLLGNSKFASDMIAFRDCDVTLLVTYGDCEVIKCLE